MRELGSSAERHSGVRSGGAAHRSGRDQPAEEGEEAAQAGPCGSKAGRGERHPGREGQEAEDLFPVRRGPHRRRSPCCRWGRSLLRDADRGRGGQGGGAGDHGLHLAHPGHELLRGSVLVQRDGG